MKNVVYINCWTDPWIKVAHELEIKQGLHPVYWIGYSSYTDSDNADLVIPQEFPGIKYIDNLEAWMGHFPKEVLKDSPDYYLDVDFLRKNADHELQAIKMMDRVDPDRYSFNFTERQRHFRRMIKQWLTVIDKENIGMVISTAIPHRLYDYVLFWLCKERGIPFIMFSHTQFIGRFFTIKDDFFRINDLFVDDWHSFEKEENLTDRIPQDILTTYNKVCKEYSEAAPAFMSSKRNIIKFESTIRIICRYAKRLLRGRYSLKRFFVRGEWKDVHHYFLCKNRKMTYENSYYSVWQQMIHYIRSVKYKKKLLDYYESQCETPDYNVPYVCHFLHYQPEATTCPGGDVFVDQSLCIELLLKNLPSSYYVYVKEHPHQFLTNRPGHSCRMKDLYDDLKNNPRVKLISIKENPFDLMKKAKAVSTISGTVGWEAMVRQKPVIAFGLCWYENYSRGVLRITDESSASNMLHFIENYKFNEHSLLAYLAAVGNNTSLAYYFKKAGKEILNISEEECVGNLTSAISKEINKGSYIQ